MTFEIADIMASDLEDLEEEDALNEACAVTCTLCTINTDSFNLPVYR